MLQKERIVPPEVATDYVAKGYWHNKTLVDCFSAHATRDPSHIAVIDQNGRRLTYGDLAVQSDALASGLLARGVHAGDVISVQMPNWAEAVVIHLAATRIGAVINPLLTHFRRNELAYILKVAGSRLVFIPSRHRGLDFVEMYAGLRDESLPDLADVCVVGGPGGTGTIPFQELLAGTARAPSWPAVDPNAIALLSFTSGTESTPKGVIHSHNSALYSTFALAEQYGVKRDDILWMPSPIGHGTGFQWGIRLAMALGATLVFQDTWNTEDALDLLEQEKCTLTYGATPFATMLLASPTLSRRKLSLRLFACAGASVPHALGIEIEQRFGCRMVRNWGMTECFVAASSSPDDSNEKCWGSDGAPLPGSELAIFDEDHRRLGPGEVGELALRGPGVSFGYLNDPERTRRAFRADGWLFSGDLASIDADGFMHFVGRMKDVINRGGLKYSAREIEELLLEHPLVKEVAIVGVPDERLGEKACAFVVPRGSQPDVQELLSALRARGTATFKLPEHFTMIDAMPMTPSGKIQKFQLRHDFIARRYETVSMKEHTREPAS